MKRSRLIGSALLMLMLLPVLSRAQAPELETIKLNEPNKKRGLPIMEAFSVRASIREWSERELSAQDLSDLLWAANGINRPDIKKKTAPSAMNAQDVDIYVFRKDGVYLYDASVHSLVPVIAGDQRSQIAMAPGGGPAGPGAPAPAPKPQAEGAPAPKPGGTPPAAPIQLLLVSDNSRFRAGTPGLKFEWGAIDTGIVSQNISLFCAGTGLGTRPRASIANDRLKTLLKLKEGQFPLLEHPVGYTR
jgi:nitroreductase